MRWETGVRACSALVALTALSACWEAPVSSGPFVVELEASAVWRASEFALRSTAFHGPDTLPAVFLDGIAAEVRYAGDNRILVRAPDTTGASSVRVEIANGRRFDAGLVLVGGAFQYMDVGPSVNTAIAWPRRDGLQIVASTWSGAPVVTFDLRQPSQALPLLPDSFIGYNCNGRGPGPSVGSVIVVGGPVGLCTQRAWYLAAGGFAALDSTSGPAGTRRTYLGAGRWLVYDGHSYWRRAPGEFTTQIRIWEGDELVLSPREDLLVVASGHGGGTEGIPVFSTSTARVLYDLPGWIPGGIAFSTDGDTIYAAILNRDAARVLGAWYHLAAFDARDGRSLMPGDSLSIPAYENDDVVADRGGRPWLYVLGDTTATGPRVWVVDRRSMRVVAQLTVPAGAVPIGGTGNDGELFGEYHGSIGDSPRRLYVLQRRFGPAKIYVFDLLP